MLERAEPVGHASSAPCTETEVGTLRSESHNSLIPATLAAAVLLSFSMCLGAQDAVPSSPDRNTRPARAPAAANKAEEKSTPATDPGSAQNVPAGPQAPGAASRLATGSWRFGVGVIGTLPPPVDQKRLTPRDKFQLYVYQNYGPQNFILPAFSAAFTMAKPPSGYPREWLDGGGAFGRWYGEQFVSSTSNRTGRLLGQLAFHEDPRYVPSGSKNTLIRITHALMFTVIDKTDSGRTTFAFSNFAGAAAGGFVGMAVFPDGHDDVAHAEQRALRGLETIAVRNIITEFRPEWEPTLKRIHIPKILPVWWTRQPTP
jgi:hypothetical protein